MKKHKGRSSLPRVRVMFDVTYCHRQDGTGRYTREMLRCLQNDPDLEVFTTAAPRVERLAPSLRVPFNGLLHLLWSQGWIPVASVLRNAHIVHTMTIAPWFAPRPTIVTLHDALDFQRPLLPSRLWSAYVRTIGGIGARRADAVVTVSAPASDEIVESFRIPAEKMHAIWNATNLHDVEPLAVEAVGPNRYVLFVGDDSTRKNLVTAIAAFETLRESRPNTSLVVTGSVRAELAEERPWLKVLAGVSDRQLAWLYRYAEALILPSRHEGFGLPLIEALTFGTPVVASAIPALLEIGGEVVRYVPPDDADGFARELEAILRDPLKAREAASAEVFAVRDLTWERAADQLVNVYLATLRSRLGVGG